MYCPKHKSGQCLEYYAIRVYVGQINAITGKNMMEERGTQDEQDYIIFPGQPWIDGICVAPGVVRQFVAMPLGSGYTVEGQQTGKEKHGGLQIEIIPAYRRRSQYWLSETEGEALQDPRLCLDEYLYLDELMTPDELGLEAGAKVRLYLSPPSYGRLLEVGDLILEKEDSCIGVAHLEAFYWESRDLSDCSSASADQKVPEVSSSIPHLIPMASSSPPLRFASQSYDIPRYHPFAMLDPEEIQTCSGLEEASSVRNSSCLAGTGSSGSATGLGETGSAGSPSWLGETGTGDMAELCSRPATLSSMPQRPKPKSPLTQLDVKAMGLAAGGKIVQDVLADHNPPTMWNDDTARLINIHVLDPVSCESVTHIVPPPIPMSIYEDIQAELPFFAVEEQIDNRLDGGDFDHVKSVSKMDEAKGITYGPYLDPNQPAMCSSCERRLCDCVVRPCDHQFCNMCIREVKPAMGGCGSSGIRCPRCKEEISRVAGFSAPMNLPGEESIRTKMPVRILKIDDGRVKFQSIRHTRV